MKLKRKIIYLILILFFLPIVSHAAGFYFIPEESNFFKNDTFIVELILDTEKNKINMVHVLVDFSTEDIQVLEFIKGGSEIDLWVKNPVVSNKNGTIEFIGGSSKGFISNNGLLGKLIIKPQKIGDIKLSYGEETIALISDGKGTPLEIINFEGFYKIEEQLDLSRVYSRTHPLSNTWNPSVNLELAWEIREDALYSYEITKDAQIIPDEKPEEIVGNIAYYGLDDGIYYFRLREKVLDKEWGAASTYRIMIDSHPPKKFTPIISRQKDIFKDKFFLIFNTTDSESGIDYFSVCEGEKPCVQAQSPYILSNQFLGKEIIVRAYDVMGHIREAKIKPSFVLPNYIWITTILLVIFFVVIYLIYRFIKKKRTRPPLVYE
ncbi:MAG: hypothetical protein U9P90_00595 [Patescibacteria group bacterium]|nr:hypothetical protein [Patescibacteria group bacterium]